MNCLAWVFVIQFKGGILQTVEGIALSIPPVFGASSPGHRRSDALQTGHHSYFTAPATTPRITCRLKIA